MRVGGLLAALGRLLPDRSGNFATMSAILLPVGIAAAAVAIDEGSLFVERREAQALTDLAAITAAANISKSDVAALTVFEDNGRADVTLLKPDEGGDFDGAIRVDKTIRVENGRYIANPLLAPDARFVVGQTPNNAVKVTYTKRGTRYFASSLLEAPMMTTVAVASAPAEAAFSVGTRLVGLDGGILNTVLGKLLGTTLSLSVMDYNALLDADVNALSFLDALATELDITAGTYDEVLAADATVGDIARAMARVGGHTHAVQAALTKLTGAMPVAGGLTLPLSHLLDMGRFGKLGIGQGAAALDADVGLLDLLSASAALANGENQVKVDTGLVLPGLAGVTVDLAIGEPPQHSPWFAVGEAGKIVRSAQTRLQIIVTVGGPGGLLGNAIRLPIYVELAYAEAKLKHISCPNGRPDSAQVSVAARPGVAEIWIGEINPADLRNYDKKPVVGPAKLVNMPIVKVTGSAHVETSNLADTTLTFSKRDIDNRVIKSVSSRNLAQSLTQSLINDLQLGVTVDLGPLSLGLIVPTQSAIKTTITQILGAVTAPVDALLYNVLATLGVRVGEADIRVSGVSCGRSVLVN